MKGKRVLITGATSGIGKIAALRLAEKGAEILLHGRNPHKTEKVRDELIRQSGNEAIVSVLADLSLKEDILKLAEEVNNRYDRLDVLINNAGGVMNKSRETNPEGWEKTMALNVLAPYMLSALLYERLQAAPEARIINTASAAHRMAKVNPDDWMYHKKYNGLQAYGDAKLCVILLGKEFARRRPEGNIVMNAMHPGVVATNFAGESNTFYNVFFKLFRPFLLSPEKGADTLIYLASDPEGAKHNGDYFVKRKPARIHFRGDMEKLQKQVWQLCEEYSGIGFPGL